MPLPALSPEQQIKPARFELRLSFLFAAMFLPLGVHAPYFPLWLSESGFDAAQIGIILAAPMFIRVITTPIITAMADKARDRATILTVTAAAAVIVSCGYFLEPSYVLVLTVSLLLAIAWAPQTPLGDSIALSGVRRFGSVYANMRIWGSIAFLVGNFSGGMVLAASGAQSVPIMITSGLLLVLVMSFFVPRLGRPRVASPLSAAELPKLRSAVANPAFMLIVGGAGLIAASHAFLFGFASIYWQRIGLADTTIGVLWSSSVLAEVLIFLAFARYFSHLSSQTILAIAGVVAILRWVAFPMISPLGFGVPGFFVVQTLHAFSTGLVLIGVQKVIAEDIPEERTGAAQGVAFFANGFSMAAATLVSGPLYAAFGEAGFYSMAILAAAGLLLIVLSRRSAP